MADSIYKWSLTAAANDAIDSAVNWRENQLPDTVNDSARNMMMRIAELREDLTGGTVTAGTQPAYTLTTKATFDTLADGRFFTTRIHATNAAGAATLNVNTLGAKAIRKYGTSGDMPLGVGDLQLGGLYQFMYSAAGNAGAGAWVISNPSIAAGGGFASGTVMLFVQAAAPVGWTKSTTHDNKALRISSVAGGGSGGSVGFAGAAYTPVIGGTAITEAQMAYHAHTQQGYFNSGTVSADHSHAQAGAHGSGTISANHNHNYTRYASIVVIEDGSAQGGIQSGTTTVTTGVENQNHTHSTTISGQTGGISANHYHGTTISGATTYVGGNQTHTHTCSAVTLALQYVDTIICTKD